MFLLHERGCAFVASVSNRLVLQVICYCSFHDRVDKFSVNSCQNGFPCELVICKQVGRLCTVLVVILRISFMVKVFSCFLWKEMMT